MKKFFGLMMALISIGLLATPSLAGRDVWEILEQVVPEPGQPGENMMNVKLASSTVNVNVNISTVGARQSGTWNVNLSSTNPAFVKDAKTEGKSYTYAYGELAVTGTVSFTGIGSSWLVAVDGGTATFNLAGGTSINAADGDRFSGDYKLNSTNPVINVTAISGATVKIIIDGVN